MKRKRIERNAAILLQCKFRQNHAKLVVMLISRDNRSARAKKLEAEESARHRVLLEKHRRKAKLAAEHTNYDAYSQPSQIHKA